MNNNDIKQVEKAMNAEIKPKLILAIYSFPKLSVSEDNEGAELNEGYRFEIDAAIPEIADAIAKFAIELPKNNFGENSGSYFITLISEYYKRLSSTDDK